MIALDMRTLLFGHIMTDVLGAIVVFFLWRQNRGRYQGLSLWTAGFALQTIGTFLIMDRGAVPDWVSMTLSNSLILASAFMVIAGMYRFVGQSRSMLPAAFFVAAFACVNFYFAEIRPDLGARNLTLSAVFVIAFGGFVLSWLKFRPDLKRLMTRIGFLYVALTLVNAFRFIMAVFRAPSSQDYMKAGLFDGLILAAYQFLFVLLTYFLILTVNQRLIGEIRFQEDKYSKAFQSSPYAIVLTDLETGLIIDVNDGFAKIAGYSREEAVGKTTFELRLWEHEEDRRSAVALLSAQGKIFELECRFRKKSGEMMTGLWSAEQIVINDRPCIFSSINDISIRKLALEGLSKSVKEKELLMKELKHRVKNSLALVSSLIGLSRESASDSRMKNTLTDLRIRIGSVSSIYDQLEWTGRVDSVQLQSYLRNLADSLAKSYRPTDGRIRMMMDVSDIAVDAAVALPLGLIFNELMINAFKYAFPGDRPGEIRVELKAVTGGTCLTVSDNGVGRPAGAVAPDGEGTGSLLIETLADQIGARVARPPGPGTTVVVIF